MPQLDPTWFASQLFWLFVSFMTLYLVMSRLVLPPLFAIMAKRRDTVDSDISLAQGMKTEAEQAKNVYERALAEARSKSQQLFADASIEHKKKADEAGKKLDHEIALKLKDAERKIMLEKQELMQSLTPTTAELTSMIVEKLSSMKPDESSVSSAIGRTAKAGR